MTDVASRAALRHGLATWSTDELETLRDRCTEILLGRSAPPESLTAVPTKTGYWGWVRYTDGSWRTSGTGRWRCARSRETGKTWHAWDDGRAPVLLSDGRPAPRFLGSFPKLEYAKEACATHRRELERLLAGALDSALEHQRELNAVAAGFGGAATASLNECPNPGCPRAILSISLPSVSARC